MFFFVIIKTYHYFFIGQQTVHFVIIFSYGVIMTVINTEVELMIIRYVVSFKHFKIDLYN